METITRTFVKFDSLKELIEARGDGKLTAQELVNGRAHIFGEWQDFELSGDARHEAVSLIVDCYGGRRPTREAVRSTLMWGRPQHWGLNRTTFRMSGDKILCSYYAGQDYPAELNTIRTALKK